MSDKKSTYYLGQLTDLKEDVVNKIMRHMRRTGAKQLPDITEDSRKTYRIESEENGGLTLFEFIDGNRYTAARNLPGEKLIDLLEAAENLEDKILF